jgi:hypothetical protein
MILNDNALTFSGNCWFVAGASLLVNGPRQQFERVVPLDQGFDQDNYAGKSRSHFIMITIT